MNPKPAVLQVMSHNILGGVRVLAAMVEDGLKQRGYPVETVYMSSGVSLSKTLRNMLGIMNQIRSGRYPIILSYSPAASIYSTFFGMLFGTRIRVIHQTAAPEGIKPLWRWLDRLFGTLGIYTHIISNSESTSATYASFPASYRRRISLIFHGVKDLPTLSSAPIWRAKLGIPLEAFVIVTSGRLSEQKNHDLIVQAIARLPGVHFVVFGEGERRAILTDLAGRLNIANRVHLAGSLPRDELKEALRMGDVFAFPSVWETFGLAAVEAAMAGLPIIASNLPVLEEVLDLLPDLPEKRKLVHFHPTHDVDAFVECVRFRQENPPSDEDLEEFSEAHRRRYSYDRMINEYDGLLGKIDEQRRSSAYPNLSNRPS